MTSSLWQRDSVQVRYTLEPTAHVLALTPPPDEGYHPAYDRGAIVGANFWDRAPADGAINQPDDILGAAAQWGHNYLTPEP